MSVPAISSWTNSSTPSAQVNPDRIYWDKLSGTSSREQRHRLAALLHYARPGDAIVVIGIDRLGRNAAEVMATIRELRDRDIVLRSHAGRHRHFEHNRAHGCRRRPRRPGGRSQSGARVVTASHGNYTQSQDH